MKKDFNVFSLWAIDDMSDKDLMKKQLNAIKECGFNGVVFHPRRYNGIPEYLGRDYMRILSELILYAKEINMDFWLYDENGWPSGSADGRVINALPNLSCLWLENNGGRVEIKERNGINSLSWTGVQKFIELTYDAYKNELSKEAFDYVGGFFSDEVGFLEGHGACFDRGGIPWSEELAKRYREEHGVEIYDKLPLLFEEKTDSFKSWYWEQLASLLSENFYGQINKWCAENGKKYTAHLKGEEHPFFSLGYNGSCFGVLKNVGVPGVDALERFCGNNYFPRIASSLARQFGNGTAMAEAMGGAGWGLEPSDVKKYGEWLVNCGINFIIFHINQLHLSYDGITDWPSSIPCHQPWCGAFRQIISELRAAAAEYKPSDTLYISPVRGVMESFAPFMVDGMNEHDGDTPMLCRSAEISYGAVEDSDLLCAFGVRFDVTDEKTFEENAVSENNEIRIGNAFYKYAVTADGCIFGDKGSTLLESVNAVSVQQLVSGRELQRCEKSVLRVEFPMQSEWRIEPPTENLYPVAVEDGRGIIDTEYISDFVLRLSDSCGDVRVNETELVRLKSDECGDYYALPGRLLHKGINEVKCVGTVNAFAYVIGDFKVFNRKPYYEFDKRQLRTRGVFYISENNSDMSCDFVLSGYPFSAKPIKCGKTITGRIGKGIYIDCTYIAAAHVFVNGCDCGWAYKGCELIKTGELESAVVECEIYQSAYNIYGPNRYVKGDNPLVSPGQYSGRKNFADESFVPDNTAELDFKLIKWKLAKNTAVLDY